MGRCTKPTEHKWPKFDDAAAECSTEPSRRLVRHLTERQLVDLCRASQQLWHVRSRSSYKPAGRHQWSASTSRKRTTHLPQWHVALVTANWCGRRSIHYTPISGWYTTDTELDGRRCSTNADSTSTDLSELPINLQRESLSCPRLRSRDQSRGILLLAFIQQTVTSGEPAERSFNSRRSDIPTASVVSMDPGYINRLQMLNAVAIFSTDDFW